MPRNHYKKTIPLTIILLASSLTLSIMPASATSQVSQVLNSQGQILTTRLTADPVYQDNELLNINGIPTFINNFSHGFPDPGLPFADSYFSTPNGIEFNGTYASFAQQPDDSPTIYSNTKIIALNMQSLQNFQNFFWTIGNDLNDNEFGIKISSAGQLQYFWSTGDAPINSEAIQPQQITYIALEAYYNESSSSYWGDAALAFLSGNSMIFNPIQLHYGPDFSEYKIYADGMKGYFQVFDTLQTNCSIASFCSTILPALSQFQVTESPGQNLSNVLSPNVAAAISGWYGYSGLNYWGYDTTSYLSPPSAGRIDYTTQTTDASMWTIPVAMNQTFRWVYFGAWLYINGSGAARIGMDFRDNDNTTVVKGAASYSLITPNQWTYVEMWALTSPNAATVCPWIQYNQASPGQFLLFDNATLSFTTEPLLNLNLQSSGTFQITPLQVLLGYDWYTIA